MTTTETCGLIDKCLRWVWLSIPLILAILINDARAMAGDGAGPNGGSIQMLEKLDCQSHGNHFYCPASSSKTGQLEIEAVRDGKKGKLATYSLPLRVT